MFTIPTKGEDKPGKGSMVNQKPMNKDLILVL